MRKVNTGVITAAGRGSRFAPFTNHIQKEFMPLLDRPIIQYVVDEFIQSGITRIGIVVNEDGGDIESYFSEYSGADITFINQDAGLPYGNASPLISAMPFLSGSEAFAFAFGDDITISDKPVIKQLIDVYADDPACHGVLGVQAINKAEIHKYSSVKFKHASPGYVDRIVEKPDKGKEFSNLASFGRYIFTRRIFEDLNPANIGKDGELWLVDAIDSMSSDSNIKVHKIDGTWMTTGDPLNYLKAAISVGMDRNDIKGGLTKFIKSVV